MSRRQLHLQKIHPSAFVRVGLVLQILSEGCGGNITWNSKGVFIQINAVADLQVLQEHVGLVATTAELNNVSLQVPDILSPPLMSLHTSLCITLTQWQSHTLTVLSIVWMGVCATQFTWNNLSSAVCVSRWWAGCLATASESQGNKLIVKMATGNEERKYFFFSFFFSILTYVYYYVEREAVDACKTVMCVCGVCVCVSQRNISKKPDKSDMKRYFLLCKAGFFKIFLCHNQSLLFFLL